MASTGRPFPCKLCPCGSSSEGCLSFSRKTWQWSLECRGEKSEANPDWPQGSAKERDQRALPVQLHGCGPCSGERQGVNDRDGRGPDLMGPEN